MVFGGDEQGPTEAAARAVSGMCHGGLKLRGAGLHEALPRCSLEAAKPAYCRCAPSTPNITVQNTVSIIGVHGLWQGSVARLWSLQDGRSTSGSGLGLWAIGVQWGEEQVGRCCFSPCGGSVGMACRRHGLGERLYNRTCSGGPGACGLWDGMLRCVMCMPHLHAPRLPIQTLRLEKQLPRHWK